MRLAGKDQWDEKDVARAEVVQMVFANGAQMPGWLYGDVPGVVSAARQLGEIGTFNVGNGMVPYENWMSPCVKWMLERLRETASWETVRPCIGYDEDRRCCIYE